MSVAVPVRRVRVGGRTIVGAAMLAVAAAGVAYPLYWNHRSSNGGAALVASSLRAIGHQSVAACSKNPAVALATRPGSPGVLEIPSLGLTAPVLDGLSDSVLNVAVGHDAVAPWPGNAGESVLEAHDVSYFASLDRIHAGATVRWLTPCGTATYVVTGTAVHAPGDFIATPPGGAGLALITCWPTNALFWTTRRWVVQTTLTKTVLVAQHLPKTTPTGPTLTVPAPPSLVAQNLTLAANESLIRLHVLRIVGNPSAAWQEGPGPMQVEANALAVYFGAYKAVTRHNVAWWSALAPGVPMPGSWTPFGAADVTITMARTVPTAITISSPTATMRIAVSGHVLRLTGLS
jgi:LPXTG-site transpeptidase (sortase) family protein